MKIDIGSLSKIEVPKPILSIPHWMLGTWKIEGAAGFHKILITEDQFRFDPKGPVSDLEDTRLIVQEAIFTSATSQLVIDAGPPGWSDVGSPLFEGTVRVLHSIAEQNHQVDIWQYRVQVTHRYLGPETDPPEIWTLRRVNP